jgi:hypothetical protein
MPPSSRLHQGSSDSRLLPRARAVHILSSRAHRRSWVDRALPLDCMLRSGATATRRTSSAWATPWTTPTTATACWPPSVSAHAHAHAHAQPTTRMSCLSISVRAAYKPPRIPLIEPLTSSISSISTSPRDRHLLLVHRSPSPPHPFPPSQTHQTVSHRPDAALQLQPPCAALALHQHRALAPRAPPQRRGRRRRRHRHGLRRQRRAGVCVCMSVYVCVCVCVCVFVCPCVLLPSPRGV